MNTQEIVSLTKNDIQTFFTNAVLKRFARRVIWLGSLLSLSVYASIRLMLHDFPFEFMEEILFILRIFFSGWVLAAVCIGGLNALLFFADHSVQIRKRCALFATSLYKTSAKQVAVQRNGTVRVISRKGAVIMHSTKTATKFQASAFAEN